MNARPTYFANHLRTKKNFEDLRQITLYCKPTINFDAIVRGMENRFTGLPQFHQSIRLKVKDIRNCETGDNEFKTPPKSVWEWTAPHLVSDLLALFEHMRGKSGNKSCKLLFLEIGLPYAPLRQELIRRSGSMASANRYFCQWVGPQIRVPVILAVLSAVTDKYYESLAVGIRGVGAYRSALYISPTTATGSYEISAGLEVSALPCHLDHWTGPVLPSLFSRCLPKDFLTTYFKNHLVPEKEEIVHRLCQYVFQKKADPTVSSLAYSKHTALPFGSFCSNP